MTSRPKAPDYWSEAGPLAALVALRATAQAYLVLLPGNLSLSADSAERVCIALSWVRHPSVFVRPSAWLPLFFWLYGTALAAWPSSLWTPVVLSIVLSNLALPPFYGICRRLGAAREASLLCTALAGLLPISVLSGLQPYFDPLFTFIIVSGLYAWLRCDDGRDARWHAAAIAFMAAAGFTRFEGWLFVAAWLLATRRKPGFSLRLLALVPIAVWTLHEAASYGRLEALRQIRERGLVVDGEVSWRVVKAAWHWILLDGWLAPVYVLALPALDPRRPTVREVALVVALPLAAFLTLTQFFGFPLPFEHLAVFAIVSLLLLPALLERWLAAWSAPLAAWAPGGETSARLGLVLLLALGGGIGAMAGGRQRTSAVQMMPWRFFSLLQTRLARTDRYLLELPVSGNENAGVERFENPELLKLAAQPRELLFDRPFHYSHFLEDGTFQLDTSVPSLLALSAETLPAELQDRSVRIVLARSPNRALEASGWRAAGRIAGYLWYARAGDELLPVVERQAAAAAAGPSAAERQARTER